MFTQKITGKLINLKNLSDFNKYVIILSNGIQLLEFLCIF